ncbi:ergosterol biosynthesis protein [Recurvomyces mirabilis]|uniref:Ergosterol biosynthesis protein n=1 Tax=Recurvomyces mirabilis TaxID=574656 RepID=A0AAE0TQQ4_9PEZI|nr:ergosterol biosynthesis protein [Recurvomyces mirabilis]KAK5150721.1 ergosterol biosynthesis protein [Recurvomyces mirabilis]
MSPTLSSYLPPNDGFLPYWLLFVSIVSIGNSAQAYLSLAGTREVYAGPAQSIPSGIPASTISKTKQNNSPVTDLSARTFGTWTALSSIIRLYAAYNIHDPLIYQLGLWTYAIAFAHFTSEWLVFGTARWGRGLAGPIFIATGTLTWMLTQCNYYVR